MKYFKFNNIIGKWIWKLLITLIWWRRYLLDGQNEEIRIEIIENIFSNNTVFNLGGHVFIDGIRLNNLKIIQNEFIEHLIENVFQY
jgi:hypothetical protein